MLRSRFFWKLYAGYVLLVLLAVTAIGVLVARRVTSATVQETEDALRVRAVLTRDLVIPYLRDDGVDADLQARIARLGRAVGTRLTVIREDGVVIADSDEDPATMDNHGARPEVLAARAQGHGTATRFSRTVAANLMYYALAVEEGGELVGYVRTSLALTAVRDRLRALRAAVAVGAALTAAVALALGLVVARRVAAPLASMTAAAESMAAGQYHQRVPASARDEVGQLGTAFNRMAGELERRMATITEDRAKLLTILSGMVEGVVAVDREERVVHLNAAAARILGVSSTASVGKPVWEVTRVRQVGDAIDQALREGREVAAEFRLGADERERVVELHGAPLRNGHGALVGAVLVLHEVTQLRRLETVRQDFVANVSHELKTPVTAIRGLIDTILDDEQMPGETRERFLQRIQSQSVRLSLLVSDLLTLARLDAVEATLEFGLVDLRDIARSSAQSFQADAEQRGLTLHTEIPSEPVLAMGDAEALVLATGNLVDNALKYTGQGGNVWLRVRLEDAWAVIEVTDTGIGIRKEHQDRIFERFYRVDPARSRELGGTGLGLSIVKHICQAHGGSVSVESALGAGSTFRVRLRAAG